MIGRYDNVTIFHPTNTYHVIRGLHENSVAENYPKIIDTFPDTQKKRSNKKALKRIFWIGTALFIILCCLGKAKFKEVADFAHHQLINDLSHENKG